METPYPAYQGDDSFLVACYAPEDSNLIYTELARLRDHGFNVWYQQGISNTIQWRTEVTRALTAASIFVYFVTEHWLASQQCQKELQYALTHKRQIVIVRLEDVTLPSETALLIANAPTIIKSDYDDLQHQTQLTQCLQSMLSSAEGRLAHSPTASKPKAAKRGILRTVLLPVLGLVYLAWKLKALALIALKFPILKFLPIIVKSGGTMVISLWFYVVAFGLWYGVGIIYLLLIHEMGHLIAARRLGIKVGAPVFIPFMGAAIAMKEAPKNAWVEAQIGIGGPLIGALSAMLMHVLYLSTGSPIFAAIAYTGYFLNLFNLTPLGILDGGRVVPVLNRWLWLVGLAVMLGLLYLRFNPIMLLVLLLSLPRVFSLFRKQSEEEQVYLSVTPQQRGIMAILYFGLLGVLSVGMLTTMVGT